MYAQNLTRIYIKQKLRFARGIYLFILSVLILYKVEWFVSLLVRANPRNYQYLLETEKFKDSCCI